MVRAELSVISQPRHGHHGAARGARLTAEARVIRILLADDHTLVRRGVRLILEQEPDLTVVAEAADGAEAVERVRDTEVDLVVLDIAMPRMTGLQAAAEIAQRRDPPKILMLSMHDNEQYFFGALKAGASGYVLKSVADEDLVGACRAAMRGETFLYPGAESTLVRDYLDRLRRGERVPASVLTAREDEVIKLSPRGARRARSPGTCTSRSRPSRATAPTSSASSGCATASADPLRDPGGADRALGSGPRAVGAWAAGTEAVRGMKSRCRFTCGGQASPTDARGGG